jgi:hypothetical protein
MTVPEHLETFLGPISRGWAPPDNRWGIQVSLFEDTPEPGVWTYTTLGLSHHVLGLGRKTVRQELIFSTWARYDADDVASFLMTLAEEVARSTTGLLRGEVIEGKPLIAGARTTGVYAAIPVFWPDEFQVLEATIPNTVMVWLLPIDQAEAQLIASEGWSRFEDQLEESDCDFWDLNRPSLA